MDKYSKNETNPQEEVLDDLVDPDGDTRANETNEYSDQLDLVAHIVGCEDVAKNSLELDPTAFQTIGMRLIVKHAQEYYKRYGELIKPKILRAEVWEASQGRKDQKAIMGEVEALKYSTTDTPAYYVDKARRLTERKMLALAMRNFQEGKHAGDRELLWKTLEKAKAYGSKNRPTKINWLQRGDIRKRAEEEPIEWYVDKWILRRGLHMLAGASFAGKSQFLADFSAAIATGERFCGVDVRQTPVVMIDCENHCSITNYRLGEKVEDYGGYLYWLDSVQIPDFIPLDADKLASLIDDFYAHTGHAECVVFLDTMRSLCQIDELDAKQVNELLYPLQRVAQSKGCAIVLLNHRPKSGAKYSGSNSMMAALDLFLMYDRESEDSLTSVLSMEGTRLQRPEPLYFKFDQETLTLLPVGTPTVDVVDEVTRIVQDALADGKGLGQEELVKTVLNASTITLGKHKARDMIKNLVGTVVYVQKADHGKNVYQLL